MENLNKLVRELREAKGLTRPDFGSKCGESEQNIYNIETDRIGIGFGRLKKIANAHGHNVIVSLEEQSKKVFSYNRSMTHHELKFECKKLGIWIQSIRKEENSYRVKGVRATSPDSAQEEWLIEAANYEEILANFKKLVLQEIYKVSYKAAKKGWVYKPCNEFDTPEENAREWMENNFHLFEHEVIEGDFSGNGQRTYLDGTLTFECPDTGETHEVTGDFGLNALLARYEHSYVSPDGNCYLVVS